MFVVDNSMVFMVVNRVEDTLTRLYTSYFQNKRSDSSDVRAQDVTMRQSSEGGASEFKSATYNIEDMSLFKLAQFKKFLESENSLNSISDSF